MNSRARSKDQRGTLQGFTEVSVFEVCGPLKSAHFRLWLFGLLIGPQGITDFIFNPELTPGQRAGRIAIAGAIGIVTAGVVIIGSGTAVAVGAAFLVGWGLSFGAQKILYPRLGLGG